MLPKDKKKKKPGTHATVSPSVKDYGNEPFFVRKAEASRKVMEKYGLPKNWVTENK